MQRCDNREIPHAAHIDHVWHFTHTHTHAAAGDIVRVCLRVASRVLVLVLEPIRFYSAVTTSRNASLLLAASLTLARCKSVGACIS